MKMVPQMLTSQSGIRKAKSYRPKLQMIVSIQSILKLQNFFTIWQTLIKLLRQSLTSGIGIVVSQILMTIQADPLSIFMKLHPTQKTMNKMRISLITKCLSPDGNQLEWDLMKINHLVERSFAHSLLQEMTLNFRHLQSTWIFQSMFQQKTTTQKLTFLDSGTLNLLDLCQSRNQWLNLESNLYSHQQRLKQSQMLLQIQKQMVQTQTLIPN